MVQNSMIRVIAFFLLLLFFACNTEKQQQSVHDLFEGQEPDSVYTPFYATGFSVSYDGDIKLVQVSDPWDSKKPGSCFIVGPEDTPDKFKTSDADFICYPVKNWSAFSSTQIVFAEKLGVLETLKSVAEPQYISNNEVQERLKAGKIRDVGLADAADLEVLLDAEPQFVFVSPFKDNRYGMIEEAGLTLINDAGYLEPSPLGRAEWFVFFSTFFNKEDTAIDLFKNIERRYISVKQEVDKTSKSPSVLTGTMFNGVWHIPAGDSYMAGLLDDAGAAYAYEDKPGTGSLSLDFETVFNDFRDCDYWVLTINHPGRFTKDDLVKKDERYSDFEAFKKNNVLFSNTGKSLFFERGIIEPDVILKDLAACFHPDLYPDHDFVYFQFLKE